MHLLLPLYTGTYVVFHPHFSPSFVFKLPPAFILLTCSVVSHKYKNMFGPWNHSDSCESSVFLCLYMTNSAIKDLYEDRLWKI